MKQQKNNGISHSTQFYYIQCAFHTIKNNEYTLFDTQVLKIELCG